MPLVQNSRLRWFSYKVDILYEEIAGLSIRQSFFFFLVMNDQVLQTNFMCIHPEMLLLLPNFVMYLPILSSNI